MTLISLCDVVHFDEIDSTNAEAKRRITRNIKNNSIITASNQTMGRGRSGKSWVSYPGNLHMSIILDISAYKADMLNIPFVAAVAVHDAISYAAFSSSDKIYIKWPNDIIIQDCKVSGILTESISINNKHYAIIGIGVNVEHAPHNVQQNTIALKELGVNLNSTQVMNLIIERLDRYINIWRSVGFSKIRSIWMDNAYQLDQEILLKYNGCEMLGKFNGIDASGNLMLTTKDGDKMNIECGEILEINRHH